MVVPIYRNFLNLHGLKVFLKHANKGGENQKQKFCSSFLQDGQMRSLKAKNKLIRSLQHNESKFTIKQEEKGLCIKRHYTFFQFSFLSCHCFAIISSWEEHVFQHHEISPFSSQAAAAHTKTNKPEQSVCLWSNLKGKKRLSCIMVKKSKVKLTFSSDSRRVHAGL